MAASVVDVIVPVIIGRVVKLLSSKTPDELLYIAWPELATAAIIMVIIRPTLLLAQDLVVNQAVSPGLANLVRWYGHCNIVRQDIGFFQDEFAGRLTTQVIQTGPALRESVMQTIRAALYLLLYGTSAFVVLGSSSLIMATPIVVWAVGYIVLMSIYVPLFRPLSAQMSRTRSTLSGRIGDIYANIAMVKLYDHSRWQESLVRSAIDEQVEAVRSQQRVVTVTAFALAMLNALLFASTGAIGIWLWRFGLVQVGMIATALPMVWQIAAMSGWVAQSVTSIFENVGVVHEGMQSLARTWTPPDVPGATPVRVHAGSIRFSHVSFSYGSGRRVLDDIDFNVQPGERLGVVGHSGAGKSTLLSLLLGLHRPTNGHIFIDGQDISQTTQDSLRAQIAIVTQDTSLLHQSVRDNIRIGRWDATDAQIEDAARRAHALDFIIGLADSRGRKGLDAHVGERGVMLSGGQKQRISLARAILKDAPILVMDEATSALDTESEMHIRDELDELMHGRTVIAIAHRLSSLAGMDRLAVLDHGKLLEIGRHEQLLESGGAYARLWRMQYVSGDRERSQGSAW
jgi:ATP-binding cassette subfamily B multidrug efflux pump